MNKKLIFYLMLIIALSLVVISCNNNSALSGIWELDRVENGSSRGIVQNFEFFKDGTGNMGGSSITWKTEGNRIMVTLGGQAQSLDYTLSGKTLTLIYDRNTNHRSIYNKK